MAACVFNAFRQAHMELCICYTGNPGKACASCSSLILGKSSLPMSSSRTAWSGGIHAAGFIEGTQLTRQSMRRTVSMTWMAGEL